jgi:serine/threonine protein phosphatase PrpC
VADRPAPGAACDDAAAGSKTFLIRTPQRTIEFHARSVSEMQTWSWDIHRATASALAASINSGDVEDESAPREWHNNYTSRRGSSKGISPPSKAALQSAFDSPLSQESKGADGSTALPIPARPPLPSRPSRTGMAIAASLPVRQTFGVRPGPPAALSFEPEEPPVSLSFDEEVSVPAPVQPPPSGLSAALSQPLMSRASSSVPTGTMARIPPAVLEESSNDTPDSSVKEDELPREEEEELDQVMLNLEERAQRSPNKIPRFMWGKLHQWQTKVGRPLTEQPVASKPGMRRSQSAPEEAHSQLGGQPINWHNFANAPTPTPATSDRSSLAPAVSSVAGEFEQEVEGPFTGSGDGADSWGVWGCMGGRERMDDVHIAIPDAIPWVDPAQDATDWHANPTNAATVTGSGRLSLYSVFDGHGGSAAARFTAGQLPELLLSSLPTALSTTGVAGDCAAGLGEAFSDAFSRIDMSFRDRAVRIIEGEDPDDLLPGYGGMVSGTTALILAIDWACSRLVVGGVGDCRAVLVRHGGPLTKPGTLWKGEERITEDFVIADAETAGNALLSPIVAVHWPTSVRLIHADDMLPVHSPTSTSEEARIRSVGGWVTRDSELLIPRLKPTSPDLDPYIPRRLKFVLGLHARSSGPVQQAIPRVCGDLGVARSIGDLDFKAPHIPGFQYCWTRCPDGCPREFSGNVVSSVPDLRVVEFDEHCEAVVIACDGLWDVIPPLDAARAAAEVLASGASPKVAARRLAEAAIHLGSNDNVTVLVVRLRNPVKPPASD